MSRKSIEPIVWESSSDDDTPTGMPLRKPGLDAASTATTSSEVHTPTTLQPPIVLEGSERATICSTTSHTPRFTAQPCYERVQGDALVGGPEGGLPPDQINAVLQNTSFLRSLSVPLLEHKSIEAALLAEVRCIFSRDNGNLFPKASWRAQRYGGEQFGVFVAKLGDGRAVSLGDVVHTTTLEVNAKGTGRTQFSRTGLDGRLTLTAACQEYYISSLLQQLGAPLCQVLAVYETGVTIFRECTGHVPAALLLRTAPSFLRIGTLERMLHDKHFSQIRSLIAHYEDSSLPDYQGFALRLAQRLGKMMGWCDAYGFYHGTLNSDNLSLDGVLIDVGSGVFMKTLDSAYCNPKTIPKHYFTKTAPSPSDAFSFGTQAMLVASTLQRLTAGLSFLWKEEKVAVSSSYALAFNQALCFYTMIRWGMEPEEGGAVDSDVTQCVGLFRETLETTQSNWVKVHHFMRTEKGRRVLAADPAWEHCVSRVATLSVRYPQREYQCAECTPFLDDVSSLCAERRFDEIQNETYKAQL